MKDLFRKAGANVNVYRDKYGRKPVHRAAIGGDTEKLKVCKGLGVDMEAEDRYGNTPAHYAVLNGRTETLKYLIEEVGVNVNIINKKGETPLDLAYDQFFRLEGRLKGKKALRELEGLKKILNIVGYSSTKLDIAYDQFLRLQERLEGKELMKEYKELKEIISLLEANRAKTGEKLREEKKQKALLEKVFNVPNPCDCESKVRTRKRYRRKYRRKGVCWR